jgi:acyl carrier protein
MLTAVQFIEPIREYIVCHHLDGQPGLDRKTPLLEWGVIDSLAFTDMLAFIEDEFEVTIPAEEITPENFQDLAAIGALLCRLDATGAGEPSSVLQP